MTAKNKLAKNVIYFAIFISVVLLGLKSWAWLQSNSISVLSSLTDSLIDVVISAINAMALIYALRPADKDHRFGHGKMEAVAALLQSSFIIAACFFIALQAFENIYNNVTLTNQDQAIGILIVAILLNLLLIIVQKYAIRITDSLIVEADSAHYIGDLLMHIAVIISLIIGQYVDWRYLDLVVAALISAWLFSVGVKIGIKALDMLLDKEVFGKQRQQIVEAIYKVDGFENLHDLRILKSGNLWLISFDIEVLPQISFIDSHEITKKIEISILKLHHNAQVMIHVDPVGDVLDSRHKKMQDYHSE